MSFINTSPLGLKNFNKAWKEWQSQNPNEADDSFLRPAVEQAMPLLMQREILAKANQAMDGLLSYRQHPYHANSGKALQQLNQNRGARLLTIDKQDFTQPTGLPVMLIIPSLINRYYILDLDKKTSFVRQLRSNNIIPLILDWGEPDHRHRQFGLYDYILQATELLNQCQRLYHKDILKNGFYLTGYCMGGLLALALYHYLSDDWLTKLRGFYALATPFDFTKSVTPEQQILWQNQLERMKAPLQNGHFLPIDLLQSWFLSIDILSAFKKFQKFAQMDMNGEKAKSFIAVEDWVNDAVPLAGPAAYESLHQFYCENAPFMDKWQLGDKTILADNLKERALVIPAQYDRIVPNASAAALADKLPNATLTPLATGHIGMMSQPKNLGAMIELMTNHMKEA